MLSIPFWKNKIDIRIAGEQIFSGKYIPTYVKPNFAWYEKDDLMTYIVKLKCDKFIEKPEGN